MALFLQSSFLICSSDACCGAHPESVESQECGGWEANTWDDRQAGYLQYGPYVTDVPLGQRAASFLRQIDNHTANDDPVAVLDVCCDYGATILASRTITRKQFSNGNSYQAFDVPFHNQANGKPLEFRVLWHGNSKLTSAKVEIGL